MNNVTIHFDSTTRLLTINGQSCRLADDDALTVETSTNPNEVSVIIRGKVERHIKDWRCYTRW
jgi:hypothetical protein